MDSRLSGLLGASLAGIGATLLMDLWNLFLKRGFAVPSLNYCLLGRWVCHMPSGVFRHASIAASPPKPHECTVGWMAHYAIGVTLALAFVGVVAPAGWLGQPTLLPALLYGTATVLFPLFVLQPSLGLGLASSRTPHPARARLKSLGTHLVFGLGLYVAAFVVRAVL